MPAIQKVSNRQIRQTVNKQGQYVEQHHGLLQQLVHDELKTRGRVDALEGFRDMTCWQRLKWLLRGGMRGPRLAAGWSSHDRSRSSPAVSLRSSSRILVSKSCLLWWVCGGHSNPRPRAVRPHRRPLAYNLVRAKIHSFRGAV